MRSYLPILLLVLFGQFCCGQQQPNIILINLDDVDENTLSPTKINLFFPNMERFCSEGMRFTNAHVTTPLCGPSRCCLLQAQYAHNTGSRVNDPNSEKGNGFDGGHRYYIEKGFDQDDLSTWMQDAGYRTMMVGKYLNNDVVRGIPAGWDDFYSSWGSKYFGTYRFTNRQVANGRVEVLPQEKNRTIAEAEDVIELISAHSDASPDQPFFMYWNPLASHQTRDAAGLIEPRYNHWWPNLRVPRTPNFDEADFSDKRGALWMLPRLTESIRDSVDAHYRERILSLRTFDDMVGQLFETLDSKGITENTYVILTSDNGWLEGHHRMNGKSVPYDRATKVPLYVLGPGVQTTIANHLIAHIDIGPTVVGLASGVTPNWIDGKSFLDVLFDPDIEDHNWREPILIENWAAINTSGLPDPVDLASTALRYFDEAYIEWFNGEFEYYHLPSDPHQIRNAYDQLSTARKIDLATEIRMIKTPTIPQVGMIRPFEEFDLVGRQFDLQGIAEDDEGMLAVKVALIDPLDRRFWNGTEWQDDFFQLTTELTNPGGQITKWRIPIDIPRTAAIENPIRLRIWAVDLSRNYDSDRSAWFRLDLSPPVCRIEHPTRHQTVFNPFAITGTVMDENEVRQVRLVIKDRDTGKFWNGSIMVDDWNFHLAALLEDGQWSYQSPLPAGRYYVSVRGIDEHGNHNATVVNQFFKVQ